MDFTTPVLLLYLVSVRYVIHIVQKLETTRQSTSTNLSLRSTLVRLVLIVPIVLPFALFHAGLFVSANAINLLLCLVGLIYLGIVNMRVG